MSELIACPSCASTDGWESDEVVHCTADVTSLELKDDGTIDINWGGTTNYDHGEQDTEGIHCRCGFAIDSADMAVWAEALFPKPDLEALLELRKRMGG